MKSGLQNIFVIEMERNESHNVIEYKHIRKIFKKVNRLTILNLMKSTIQIQQTAIMAGPVCV